MVTLHFLLSTLLILPVVLTIWGYVKGRSKDYEKAQDEHPPKPFAMIFNSAVLYALAYNIIFFIQELFLALGKKWIGLKAFLYHNNHSWEGSDPRAALMQGLGALAIFIIGILLLGLFLKIRRSSAWGKLFILWLAYHGLIQSLPQLSTAPMDRGTDVGQALTYFQLSETIDYGLAALSILGIFVLAYLFSRWFLEFTPGKYNLDHPFARFKSQFRIAVLPAIVGTILIFPFRIPPIDRFTATYMLLFICIPLIFAFSWMIRKPEQMGNQANQKIFMLPLVLLILLLAFFQLVLAPGVIFQ